MPRIDGLWYTTLPTTDILGLPDFLVAIRADRAVMERAAEQERLVKLMLGRWVSELEPVLVFNRGGGLLGLAQAGIPIGACCPIIVRVEDVS